MKFKQIMGTIDRARQKGIVFLAGRCSIFLISLPAIILVRIIRPLICFRFSPLTTSRIGHLSTDTELYLQKRKMAENTFKRTIDIFYCDDSACNQQLFKMWKEHLRIWPAAKWLDKVNGLIPGSEPHIITEYSADGTDYEGVLSQTKPILSFTADEEKLGQEALSQMGIGPKDHFICFHCRDSQYLKTTFPDQDFSYHDYRDADINSYHLALKGLSQKGHFLIRMGKYVERGLDAPCEKVIDYASSSLRSDFLDIYLSAKCRFFLSCNGGINAVPRIFRRPVIFLNHVSFEQSPSSSPDYLILFKKYWLIPEKRFMTFPEIIKSGVGLFSFTHEYKDRGIELVNNTDEEIREVAIEMEQRISGEWKAQGDDDELQQRFWALFDGSKYHGVRTTRVGAAFLRENQALLGESEARVEIKIR